MKYKNQEWLFLGLMCFVASVFNFGFVMLIQQWWCVINLLAGAVGLLLSGITIRKYQEDREG